MTNIEQLISLKIQLEKLKHYENIDFKDLIPGSFEWLEFWQLFPQLQEQMLAWQNGSVIVIGDITPEEETCLKSRIKLKIPLQCLVPEERLFSIIGIIVDKNGRYDFAYIDLPMYMIKNLNELLKYFKLNIRVI
jgi:hypothetical protein